MIHEIMENKNNDNKQKNEENSDLLCDFLLEDDLELETSLENLPL